MWGCALDPSGHVGPGCGISGDNERGGADPSEGMGTAWGWGVGVGQGSDLGGPPIRTGTKHGFPPGTTQHSIVQVLVLYED